MQATNFLFRISTAEKRMLTQVAKRLERSRADVIRVLIRQQYDAIKSEKTDGATEGLGLSKVHERA